MSTPHDPRTPAIHYVSDHDVTGYGVAARRAVRGLESIGCPVRWTPFTWSFSEPVIPREQLSRVGLDHLRDADIDPDVFLVHATPEIADLLDHLRPAGVPLVLSTVWEHEWVQPQWPALINRYDAVVVPTQWNADAFIAAGVTVPVLVVPPPVDDESDGIDTDWLEAICPPGKTLFHTVGVWRLRKSPGRAVEAYLRAFDSDEDVFLLVKSTPLAEWDAVLPDGPDHLRDRTWWLLADVLRRYGPGAGLHLATQHLGFAELAGLHHRSDAWVSLPYAEGWDLGCFDAAAAGCPVVTTSFGGPLEYLDPELSFLIPGETVAHPNLDGATWLRPDVDAAVEALRTIRDDPDRVRSNALRQAEQLRRRYAPAVVARTLIDQLRAAGVC